MTRSTVRFNSLGFPGISFFDSDKVPHWQKSHQGGGTLNVEFTVHPGAKWLQIDTTETPKKGQTRRTMATLDRASAEVLRDYLCNVLGSPAIRRGFPAEALRMLGEMRIIDAIKEYRRVRDCGLREAKDAVEDEAARLGILIDGDWIRSPSRVSEIVAKELA